MRGEFFHNLCLVEPVARRFEALGAAVYREHRVNTNRLEGYVDALVEAGELKLVLEAEQRPERINRDMAKAAALNASLLVLVPTGRVAQAVERRLALLAPTSGSDCVPIVAGSHRT